MEIGDAVKSGIGLVRSFVRRIRSARGRSTGIRDPSNLLVERQKMEIFQKIEV